LKASVKFEAKSYLLTKEEGVVINRLSLVINLNFFLGQQM